MICLRDNHAFTLGWFFQRLIGRHAVIAGQRIVHIHGVQGDPAANANVACGPAHLVGVRSSRL
jgi:hypothetical protein